MMLKAATDGPLNIGEMVMEHAADAYGFGFKPFWYMYWPSDLWVVQLGGMSINLTPTKHVVFMIITSLLVFWTMKAAGNQLIRQRAAGKAPGGFAGAIEAMVLFIRNDVVVANIGHGGAKFAPFIITLFFFILYGNLLGLVPFGASPTGNLAVTATLAIMVFLVVEIAGFRTLGFKGYMGTIFPKFPGMSGPGAVALSIGMAPIELLGKLVKPFALAVRLFGNMTAGKFVILALFGIVFLFGQIPGVNVAIGLTTAALVVGITLLKLIVAFLQAYVFALLSAVFIGLMQHEH